MNKDKVIALIKKKHEESGVSINTLLLAPLEYIWESNFDSPNVLEKLEMRIYRLNE